MEEQKKLKRALFWILLVFFLLLVLPATLLAGAYFLWGRGGDIPPQRDDDLYLETEYLPQSKNAYYLFYQAAKQAAQIDRYTTLDEVYELFGRDTGNEWTEEKLRRAIASLGKTLVVDKMKWSGRRREKTEQSEYMFSVPCTDRDMQQLQEGKIPKVLLQASSKNNFSATEESHVERKKSHYWQIDGKYLVRRKGDRFIISNPRYLQDLLDDGKIPQRIVTELKKSLYPMETAATPSVEIHKPGKHWSLVGAKHRYEVVCRGKTPDFTFDVYVDIPLSRQCQSALHKLERGLELSDCLYPWSQMKQQALDISGLRFLSYLLCAKALQSQREGAEQRAWDIVRDVLRVGEMIANCKGTYIHTMCGWIIQRTAFLTWRKLLAATSLPSEKLLGYVSELEGIPLEEQYIAGLKAEYNYGLHTIEEILTNREKQYIGSGLEERWGRIFFFQPNRTRHLLAQACRVFIDAAGKTHEKGLAYEKKKFSQEPLSFISLDNSDWQFQNYYGIKLCRILHIGGLPYIHQHRFHLEATRLFIALKCYRLDHGALPKKLPQLVPDYLSKLPIDTFHGKPLGYSRKKREVYSDAKAIAPQHVEYLRFVIDF